MSKSIFETFTDERGNISVRISQEVQVLTREEANRIEAEYRRMQAENAELRHDLEEANNQAEEVCIENAKLREELADAPKCETCEAMLDCDECLRADGSHKERRRLSADNAKLRELAAGIGHLLFTLDVDYCAICPRDDINHPCPVHTVKGGECLYETDLRDLGVEVDG